MEGPTKAQLRGTGSILGALGEREGCERGRAGAALWQEDRGEDELGGEKPETRRPEGRLTGRSKWQRMRPEWV